MSHGGERVYLRRYEKAVEELVALSDRAERTESEAHEKAAGEQLLRVEGMEIVLSLDIRERKRIEREVRKKNSCK